MVKIILRAFAQFLNPRGNPWSPKSLSALALIAHFLLFEFVDLLQFFLHAIIRVLLSKLQGIFFNVLLCFLILKKL